MVKVNLSDIERGIRSGQSAVESLRTWVKGVESYRICDERERALRDAERAVAELYKVWPKAQALIAESERSYDRYVTRDYEPDGCSCHLSAPCSFCTMQADEDDDSAQSEAR